MPIKHLDGKVAIVTGGAGGMGSWVCKIFAEQGAKVVVVDTGADVEGRMGMDPSKVNALVDEIKAAGGEATGSVGDVTEMAYAEEVVAKTIEQYGKLDILVCAHGILRERMIFNMLEDEWDGLIKVHLKGCFTMTKFASIHWRATRAGGRIIYFTSTAGIRGGSGQPNYSAAHFGKIGLMLSNAQALGRYGVTCNAISPNAATRMTDRGLTNQESQREGALPPSMTSAGTTLDPKNVVPTIVYLASDQGGNVTGHAFGVMGYQVSVWHMMEWENSIYWHEPYWDIDKLFEVMPKTLGAYGWELPPNQI